MEVQVIDIDRTRRRLEVILPKERVLSIQHGIYAELQKKAQIKGFRKGKIPRSVIDLYFRDYINRELKKRIVENSLEDALKEANLEPLLEPTVEFPDEDMSRYIVFCEVVPEIEVHGYTSMEIDVEPIDVTEEEVRVELEKLRNIHAELVPKEEGVVERGDFVVVRYEGYHDGLPLEEVRSEAYPLEVGSETLLPEFEAALIGMRKDEEKEIEIDFPPDYPDRAYASKRIRFHLRVKEIKQRRLPHIGDDFAKDLGFDDLSALMDGIRERIRGQKGKQRRAYVERAIIERLLEKNEIPVPPSYLSWRLERSLERMRAELKKGGYTRAEEEVLESVERDKVKKDLERRIKEEILIVNIARMESIVVTDEEVEDRLRRIASEMKKAYEEVRALYSSKGLLVPLKADMLEEKVLNFLVDSAIIKERNP